MKRFFQRRSIAESIKSCWRRFPAAICFVVALTLYFLLVIWMGNDAVSRHLRGIVVYYLSAGCLLSLVLQLWAEEVKRRRTVCIVKAAAHVLLAADAAGLYLLPHDFWQLETTLAHASVLSALAAGIFILPFFRERDDLASWNFTLRVVCYSILAKGTGIVMLSGISLLTLSLTILFGVSVKSEVYFSFIILCNLLLSSLLIFGLMPSGGQKHDRTSGTPSVLNKIIRYLLLPLLGCYIAVLYSYMARIVIDMQLPNGWVSKLVIALMAGLLAVEAGFYPSVRQEGKKAEKAVSRWLPVLILPPLVLMSIAIARRIGDYGLTVSRLYAAALNVWFYAVCIGLFCCRARRISWIPASLAALFVLVSALPVNFTSITRNHLRKEFRALLDEAPHGQLPLDEMHYRQWLDALTPEQANRAGSLLSYMEYTLDDPEITTFIDKSGSSFSYINESQQTASPSSYFYTSETQTPISLPAGYGSMQIINRRYSFTDKDTTGYDDIVVQNDTLNFRLYLGTPARHSVRIPLAVLKQAHMRPDKMPITLYKSTKYCVMMTRFHFYHSPGGDSFTCDGYIFSNP